MRRGIGCGGGADVGTYGPAAYSRHGRAPVGLHAGDRIILATLAKLLPRDRWPIFMLTPSTPLRRHRELIRRSGVVGRPSSHPVGSQSRHGYAAREYSLIGGHSGW